MACDDSDIEDYEKIIERGLKVRREKDEDTHDGRRSDNSELLHSVRSSKEFWEKT